ncbi:MAG: GNAT family N-acetyltransferase [Bacteroidota bacterium]
MIRPATKEDIVSIMQMTKACAQYLSSQGIFQWNEHYPNQAVFKQDLKRKELYVLEIENQVVGSICISTLMDEEYFDINWLTENQDNCYIHRLAVHPKYQGQNHARKFMDYAENKAKDQGLISIRLDTFSQNKRNQKFYELRGYVKLDEIYFPKQSEHPFYCYELIL